MAKMSFSQMIGIVEEFFDNAIDGQLSYEEYVNNYGHHEDSNIARDNYRVCTQSLRAVKAMGLEPQLKYIYESIQTSFEWKDLSVSAQNNSILTYKNTYIDDIGSCGHDAGLHFAPIEEQIAYMREYLSECEHLFDDRGIMVA